MRTATLLLYLGLLAACESVPEAGRGDEEITPDGGGASIPPPTPLQPPGGTTWSASSVTCDEDDDCNDGETCEGGLCQMERCAGSYRSGAPLGEGMAFFRDRELAIVDGAKADGQFWMDSYELSGSTIAESAARSFRVGDRAAKDVAGGAFYGVRPESLAAIFEGSSSAVIVDTGGKRDTLTLDFVPVAIAAGDVDGDKLDELLALSAAGEIDICEVDAKQCEKYTFSTQRRGLDIAAADTDADGVDEVVLLFAGASSSQTTLMVWNTDAETDGLPAAIQGTVNARLTAVAAGDLDGDERAEIAFLEDGGWLGWASDKLNVYSTATGTVAPVTATWLNGDTLDLAVGDTDGDSRLELATLDDDKVHVYRFAQNQLTSVAVSAPHKTGDPRRLAFADLDGDSPAGHLVEGPGLLSTNAVPTMVVTFPPYDRAHADGKAFVEVGERSSTTTRVTDTVSLSLGVDIGYEAGVDGIGKVRVGAKIAGELRKSRSNEVNIAVGSRLSATPEPDLHGFQYGAVVMACGCFHEYTYVLDDPRGKLGGDGRQVKILVPVGGQTTLWSTPRYNALARARGDLPIIEVPYRIGELSSYPTVPTSLEGRRLQDVDLVFPDPPSFTASDVGNIGWSLSVGDRETNDTAMSASLTLSAGVNAAGFAFGGSVGAGLGRAYSVSVGTEATFSGGIPPIRDNPATPEDEYRLFRYSFRPVVYKQGYKDHAGNDAAFYVVTYHREP